MARTDIPSSVDALQQLVRAQQAALDAKQATIDEQAALITFFQEWKRLIDSQRFGSRSEKIPPEQGRLFNEAEIEATAGAEDDDEIDTVAVPAHTRKKRGRRPLPDFRPRDPPRSFRRREGLRSQPRPPACRDQPRDL